MFKLAATFSQKDVESHKQNPQWKEFLVTHKNVQESHPNLCNQDLKGKTILSHWMNPLFQNGRSMSQKDLSTNGSHQVKFFHQSKQSDQRSPFWEAKWGTLGGIGLKSHLSPLLSRITQKNSSFSKKQNDIRILKIYNQSLNTIF